MSRCLWIRSPHLLLMFAILLCTCAASWGLPSPWQLTDIGTSGGTASYASSTFTIEGSGWDIWSTSDGFCYVYQSLSGNGSIVARVASVENTHWYAKAGVMIRETLDAGSTNTAVVVTPSSGMAFQWRATTNDQTSTEQLLVGAPRFVKLERSGNNFTAYESTDGSSWSQLGTTQSISMATDVYVGMCVSAHVFDSTLCTGTFDAVSVVSSDTTAPAAVSDLATSSPTPTSITLTWTAPGDDGSTGTADSYDIRYSTSTINEGNWASATQVTGEPAPAAGGTSQNMVVSGLSASTTYYFAIKTSDQAPNTSAISNSPSGTTTGALPSPWQRTDIGTSGGTAGYASSTFTIEGSGWDIWSTSDGFCYVYQSLSGNGSIVARVVSVENTHWYAKAGVMIRETLASGSKNAAVVVTPTSGMGFQWRAATSGATSGAELFVGAPRYVKLERSGNNFSAYESTDGSSWSQLGTTQSIGMATDVYVGMCVSAHDWEGALCTGTFDNVSVVSGDTTAPTAVSNLATSSPTSSSITLSWTAPGDDGSTGTAASYDIRYSTSTINEGNWASATQVTGEPAPTAAGTNQSVIVSGLSAGTTYYFAIKTSDEVPNASAISNSPSGTTSAAGSLPSPWQRTDIGTSGGTASYSSPTFTIEGSGWDIWSTSDGFCYVYQSLNGDGTIVARVTSVENTHYYAKGGVMIRETLDGGSKNAAVVVTPTSGTAFQWRAATNNPTYNVELLVGPPLYVKLQRSGTNFSAYQSADGNTWSQLGTTQSISMATNVYVGMCVSAHDAALCTSTFDSVSVTSGASDTTAPAAVSNLATSSPTASSITLNWTAPGDDGSTGTAATYDIRYSTSAINESNWASATPVSGEPFPAAAGTNQSCVVSGLSASTTYYFAIKTSDEVPNTSAISNSPSGTTSAATGLPAPWQRTDVATSGGTASYAGSTFTIQGSGWDIWGTADGFCYVYQPLSGDGTVIARVASVEYIHGWSKAGVMIRETLDTGSKNVAMLVTPTCGTSFQWRPETDDPSYFVNDGGIGAPWYVKLQRSGNNFSAYESSNGTNWSQIGTTQSISMASNVFVGMCVSAHVYDSTLCTATFDNVSVATGGSDVTAPAAVTNLATSNPSSSSITLTWTAPGDDGSNGGTASSYDIRYSTSTINEGNWASATQVTGEPAPAAAGTNQSVIVSGLSASTTYYFAIKTADEVPNTSAISNCPSGTTASAGDSTAPAALSNLATSNPTSSSITLTWTAPGDDGSTGTAAGYDIRYRTGGAVNDSNWASATQVTGEPTPAAAGTNQSMTIGGLSASTTYYFAIKTSDEVPNTSAISNSPSGATVQAGPSTIIALKRHAGLVGGGGIDARFAGANIITDVVQDSLLWDAQHSRYYNGGLSTVTSDGVSYIITKFNLAAVAELNCATINMAQLRSYHSFGNGFSSMGGAGRILTHDWTEGFTNYSAPGATGGVSWAHPVGYHTGPNQNASGGDTPPLASWGYNSDSFFDMNIDALPVTDPFVSTTGAGYNVIDVTADVQAWVRGSYPNYGWIQRAGAYHFWTSDGGTDIEPVLFIDYSRTGDITPPAAVANLAAGSATSSSLTVTWTAPGDDGSSGTAASYDLRYSSSPINAGNWGAAGQASGEPIPAASGTNQSVVVTGLKANTAYYFAIKTADEMGNTSALSNLPTGQTLADVSAPAAVTNLATSNATPNTMTLSWTAPGDDGSTGTADSYDIRYSTSTINEGNWASATPVLGEPVPAAAGTNQNMVVTGLVQNTTYYFAMKTSDEIPNASGLSNVVSAQTPPDTVAPAAVTNLAVVKTKSSTLMVSWTAPGDDGSTGTAATYDIRYSTSTINAGNWASATPATNEPVPTPAGTTQRFTIRNLTAQTTYYVALKAMDEAPNASGLSNVVSGQTTDTSAINRPVLCPEDFEFLGAFLLPYAPLGHSSAFSQAGLTMRKVGGQTRFILAANINSGNGIYEVSFPGWGTQWGTWPQASITNEWGTAVYGTPDMRYRVCRPLDTMWTGGLNWDEATGRLYYSWGPSYNAAGDNLPGLAYTTLTPTLATYGPFVGPTDVNNHKLRGGSVKIPDWFSSHVGGRTLGLGFGGPYSGNHSCSQGPFLAAAYAPNESTTTLDTVRLIDYPYFPEEGRFDRWLRRDGDYTSGWTPAPINGVGFWTYLDLIEGAGTWIDLPDKHGILYAASMAHGAVSYIDGTAYRESYDNEWWMYDPSDLVAVAQGNADPWDPQPDHWHMTYFPPENVGPRLTYGFAFDPETRTLYLRVGDTYHYGCEWYPLILGWHIN